MVAINQNELHFIFNCAEECARSYSDRSFDVYSKEQDIQGYTTLVRGIPALVFQGTNSLPDWKVNLTLGFVNRKKGVKGVHKGYFRSYNKGVRKQVKTLFLNESTVVTTGHSSGGVYAQLAALQLAMQGKEVVCITFGCPKSGGKEFIALLDDKITHYRIANLFDLVTHVPLFGYYHSGTLIRLSFLWRWHNIKQYVQKMLKVLTKKVYNC